MFIGLVLLSRAGQWVGYYCVANKVTERRLAKKVLIQGKITEHTIQQVDHNNPVREKVRIC